MEEYLGNKVSIGDALSFSLSRFFPLIGASIIVFLIIFVGTLLCCIPGIYFAITYAFVSQIVVLERMGPGRSLERSSKLINGHRWRVFGVLILVGIASSIIQTIIKTLLEVVLPPTEIIPAENGPRMNFNAFNFIVDTLLTQLVSILFSTYMAVCTTLLYLDLRIRKEGFDLELAGLEDGDDERPRRRRDDDYEDDDRYDDEDEDDRRKDPRR
ncbi:MAG TPA: hypothetical protein VGL71_05155 [Urbifossiella sp.]